MGENFDVVNILEISKENLRSLSHSLLDSFKPNSLVEEFQTLNLDIIDQVSSLNDIDRFISKVEKNSKITIQPKDLLDRGQVKQLIAAYGGAGKTHTLWSLGTLLIEHNNSIPIFISLRDFTTIEEIEDYLDRFQKGVSLEKISKYEDVIFLFDGLTEFSKNNQQSELKKLFGLLKSTKSISTSRSINVLTDCESWNLELIDKEQIVQFILGSGFDADEVSDELFELLGYPLMLILYVLLGGRLSTISELFTEYFNQLTRDILEREKLHRILSLSVLDMEINNRDMKWNVFEARYLAQCEVENKSEFRPKLDKLGLFNKRGVFLEPLHDLYWEWLVGCGILYSWNDTKDFLLKDFSLRKKLSLSFGMPYTELPSEEALIEVLSHDMEAAANYHVLVVDRAVEYKGFLTKFDSVVNEKLSSEIEAEQLRGVAAAILSKSSPLFEKVLIPLASLIEKKFNVRRLIDITLSSYLWDNRDILENYIKSNDINYIFKTVVENSGEERWSSWAERLYLKGDLDFKSAMPIYFACSDSFPQWISNQLLTLLNNRNSYLLRSASQRGSNLMLANWLFDHYSDVVKDVNSGWYHINDVIISCGNEELIQRIAEQFYDLSESGQELIIYALEKTNRKWVSSIQAGLLQLNLDNHYKKRIFELVDDQISEETIREWLKSDDEEISEMAWRALTKRKGLDILDELVNAMPQSFADIHRIPTLRALSELDELPKSMETELVSRIGSPMQPMATEDYIVAMGKVKPNGILNILNMIQERPLIFGFYHFQGFAKIFSQWTKESGVRVMADFNGNTFTILEYFLYIQLQQPNAKEWFSLVNEYSEHDVLFGEIAKAIESQIQTKKDLSGFAVKRYHSDIYEVLERRFDSLTLYNIHNACLDSIPEEKMLSLANNICDSFESEVSMFLYHLSKSPKQEHINVYRLIFTKHFDEGGPDKDQIRAYVAGFLSCLERHQIIDELSGYITEYKNEVINIIRLVEENRGELFINESYSFIS